MKGKELLEKYPLTTEAVRKWCIIKLEKSFTKDIPKEFADEIREQGFDNVKIENIIDHSPSLLFSFFDENEIYICVKPDGEGEFSYFVNEKNSGHYYEIREQADNIALMQAFEMLEEKLT